GAVRREVDGALRAAFRPEFLNRIDEIVTFDPLGPKEIEAIVGLQVQRLGKLLGEQRIALALSPEALARIGAQGYDPAFGARPVKRDIQRLPRDPLAEKILAGEVAAGDTLRVDPPADGGTGLVFHKA